MAVGWICSRGVFVPWPEIIIVRSATAWAGLVMAVMLVIIAMILIVIFFLFVICVPCPRSYCSLCHVNLYILLLLLLLLPIVISYSWPSQSLTDQHQVNGWTMFWPVKIRPDMTYNVFGGTLSLTQSLNQSIKTSFIECRKFYIER